MNTPILRQAKAVVYFRMLRAVGRFFPVPGTKHFVFRHCRCCQKGTEELLNGLPSPVTQGDIRGIVQEYSQDLGPLCEEYLRSS